MTSVQSAVEYRPEPSCSSAVNSIATEYELAYSCSCCPDPELYVRVFMDTPHGRVYGVPYQMTIGERDGIDYPADAWDELLRGHGIQSVIIDRLQAHFDSQTMEDHDEALCCSAI